VTFGGDGHTAYTNGDECVDDHVNGYLLELELPPPDAFCGDPALAPPPPTPEPTQPPGAEAPVETPEATPPPGADAPAETPAATPPPAADVPADDEREGLSGWAWAGVALFAIGITGAIAAFALRQRRN
jgi:hypothetical protein